MLLEFKKRIDTLRDILVGAVPSPAGQIEQITYALIYKFMSDIDDRAASIPGGKRTYFTGEYEKYGWHELMTPTLGAHDRLTLYREALGSLAKNPGLPELFQGIYQNAYLTFNDPRVLTLFLKEIDNFKHSGSDDIGDAYEYLLQITGAQGDVGQFRTPRHIIKFIVEAVNPTKSDSVLDPAVGTAGFLIAAYNHVKHHHDGVDEISGLVDEKEERLTADELNKLHKSYHGFDIDPTMVRTAKVNMYLHGFKTPDIKNHDSLSSEDWWNERYDVILANPPFMSPKGGIKPHDKFGITANRAEVLFVDYIASHLKPTGRAGIVVPEGIIFQSNKAYKELRKNLVDNYLYAVVSLPAGVFQPYSGVKTSVLLLDKELAKQRNEVLFVKIENDGYSLGAQRRETIGSQFPEALEVIKQFQNGHGIHSEFAHSIGREQIAESGDYNLSGDRYKMSAAAIHKDYPTVNLGELEAQGEISFLRGANLSKKDITLNGQNRCIHYGELYTLYNPVIKDVRSRTDQNGKVFSEIGDVLVPATTTAGPMGIAVASSLNKKGVILGGDINIARTKNQTILGEYLSWSINYPLKETLATYATGVNIYHLSNNDLRKLNIILPPIEIQREIVAELSDYQKIIDAAHTIVKTYKPAIKISPDWNKVPLGDISDFVRGPFGGSLKKEIFVSEGFAVYEQYAAINDNFDQVRYFIDEEKYNAMKRFELTPGDVIVSCSGTMGKIAVAPLTIKKGIINQALLKLSPDQRKVTSNFLRRILETPDIQLRYFHNQAGSGIPNVPGVSILKQIEIPLPSLEVQDQIVAQLEAEQSLIDANKKLIDLYIQKIKTKIAEVWGE